MSYSVRYIKAAKDDIIRLYDFLLMQDIVTARKAFKSTKKGVGFL